MDWRVRLSDLKRSWSRISWGQFYEAKMVENAPMWRMIALYHNIYKDPAGLRWGSLLVK